MVGITSTMRTGSRDGARRDARAGDEQRDADGGVVDEEAVQLLLVLAQRFAVVARHHHERVIEPAIRGQAVEQPPTWLSVHAISAS